MGKPVGPPFEQMVHKFRAGKFDLRIVFTIWPETGIKDSFEGMEQIPVWNIPSGKTGLPFWMFHRSSKFFGWNQIFQKIFVSGKQPSCFTHQFLLWHISDSIRIHPGG